VSCVSSEDDGIVVGGAINVQPPKLLDQVRAAIRARHYSRRTEEAYVHWIRRYILFHHKQHPKDLSESHVTAFLTSMAVRDHVSASTQNQALSALLFLYKAVLHQELGDIAQAPRDRTPHHVPVVLSVADVRRVLEALSGVVRLVASLLYGAGLRLQECLELRVKEIDFERREGPARDVAGLGQGASAGPSSTCKETARRRPGARIRPRSPSGRARPEVSFCADGMAMAIRVSRQPGSAGTRPSGRRRDFICMNR
jgi:integrase